MKKRYVFLLQAPPNSRWIYYNYKGHHSINLLGISDANYCFTIVDIGAEGRQSDGGVFSSSEIGKRFELNLFKLPNAKQIEINGPELYVLVADKAFPLSMYTMRSYPRNGKLDIRKKVFNYRLSRARRVVENAFGLLVARWRIYRRPIIANVSNVRKIVQATVVLNNFIIKNEEQLTESKSYLHISKQIRIQVMEFGICHFVEAEAITMLLQLRGIFDILPRYWCVIFPVGKSVAKWFLIYLKNKLLKHC